MRPAGVGRLPAHSSDWPNKYATPRTSRGDGKRAQFKKACCRQTLLKSCEAYVEIHATMRPAREVGGDLYDFFLIDSDHLAVTVGDVCGKGIPAALFMAMTQMVMRYMLRQETEVGAAATAGNALLAASNREMMFATLFCFVLDLKTGVLSYCSCGHHSPIILRSGNRVEKISTFNLPLGVQEKAKYKTNSLILEPGDRVFLFTDGFVDAINNEGARFGDEQLHEVVETLRALPSQDFVRDLMKSVDNFADSAPQFDDLTALLATVIARNPITTARRSQQAADEFCEKWSKEVEAIRFRHKVIKRALRWSTRSIYC